jgi:IgGFc binding protein
MPDVNSGLRRAPFAWIFLGAALSACSSSSNTTHSTADSGPDGGICSGMFTCDGQIAKACNGGGEQDCSKLGEVCTEDFGCVTCLPGEQGSCSNGVGKFCLADGSGYETFDCDPVQGMQCDPDGCKGSCAPPALADSYLGCDYYPTVTPNPVWSGFDFAVAVANAGQSATTVHVTRGATAVKTLSVAPGALQVIKLPWVSELKGGDVDACQTPPEPGVTRIVQGGAYRLRTDQPVTVYQLSALEYQISPAPAQCPLGENCPGGQGNECLSYSNDASLLLPATTLTDDYASIVWPSTNKRSGFLAVTATQDATQVQLFGNGQFAAGAGIAASGNGTVTLNRGDVLLALADHSVAPGSYGADISGTRIKASHPVQVIGGQSCANIPTATTDACDHIEHAMLPVETLGNDYLVTFPAALASTSPHVVRIEAIQSNTHLTFDPSSISAPTTLQPASAPLELDNVTKDFRVTSDKPLLVVQFMQGQASVPSGSGDPSMAVDVPTAQFRKSYIFFASSTYDTNFVNIIAQSSAAVTLDGSVVPTSEFSSIGASGYSVARHQLTGSSEVHTIKSDAGFGILVYGYGRYTSYMYPGGLDLKQIAPPPVY